jgi:hypothetical protein
MITLTGTSVLRHVKKVTTPSPLSRIITWSANQQENRLLWLGIVLAVHGCVLTPLTAMIVMATTYNFALFMAAIVSMAFALVTNLAALPTRVTIPAFFFSVAVDLAIIAASFSMFLK